MAEAIGIARCPLCGSLKARLSLSRSLLPVLTCSSCQAQVFARGDRSDELMRALLVEAPAPAVKVEAPPPAQVASTAPDPAPSVPIAPPPKKKSATGTAFDALLNLGGAS